MQKYKVYLDRIERESILKEINETIKNFNCKLDELTHGQIESFFNSLHTYIDDVETRAQLLSLHGKYKEKYS